MGKQINLLLLFVLGIFLISLVGAEVNSYAPVKQDDCVTIKQTCASCTYVNLSVAYPNSTLVITNGGMTNEGGGVWTYEFCNTSVLGRYDVLGSGDLEAADTSFDILWFDVTYIGKQLSEASAVMYIGFLALLVLVFFLNFIGMGFLPNRNQKDEEGRILSISYLKYFRNVLWMTGYFLFIAIIYVASNLAFAFMEEQFVANILFTIFKITFGAAPVIIILWLIWIFVSMFHDKQFQQMLNRGVFPGGNL